MAQDIIKIYNPNDINQANMLELISKKDFTPFGKYDFDVAFRLEAERVTKYCAYKLGYPMTEIELEPRNFYACFEDAVNTYGAEVFQYKIRENYFSLEGTERKKDENLEDKVINPTLSRVIKFSADFATEAMAGGNMNIYKDYINIYEGEQDYDFDEWVQERITLRNEYLFKDDAAGQIVTSESIKKGGDYYNEYKALQDNYEQVKNTDKGGDLKKQLQKVDNYLDLEEGIEIRTLYYQQPPAIQRYFDPFAGQGSGIQALQDIFGYGQFSPGINFLLLPISFDVALLQAIEFNDQIRRSNYTYQLIGSKLRVFPIPTRSGEYYFEYYKIKDRKGTLLTSAENNPIITNISNVPYEEITFSQINAIGRQWIRQYTLASVKELLAYVRGKFGTIPIPGSEATLNQAELASDARTEKEELIENLRDTLEQSSRQMQLEQRAKESENQRSILGDLPLYIYRL